MGSAFIGDLAIITDPAFICAFDINPRRLYSDLALNGDPAIIRSYTVYWCWFMYQLYAVVLQSKVRCVSPACGQHESGSGVGTWCAIVNESSWVWSSTSAAQAALWTLTEWPCYQTQVPWRKQGKLAYNTSCRWAFYHIVYHILC